MTQQFKFGDHVRRKEDGAIGVVVDTKFSSLWVVFEGDSTSNFYDFEEFEPIRHPDTVRLDWLADRDNHIGNVQLPAECVACNLHSLRDAIDMAMQMDKENTGTQEKDA